MVPAFTDLLQVLTGFYIASLAAVATFNKPGLDDPMAGDPPTLREDYCAITTVKPLTRRRFLCLLFGYLSWLSLFLYFIGKGGGLIQKWASINISYNHLMYCKWLFIAFFL